MELRDLKPGAAPAGEKVKSLKFLKGKENK